jgi:hypothetical protein
MTKEERRAREAIEAAGGLVSQTEIAAEWGVTPQAVHDRIRRGNFPEPIKQVRAVNGGYMRLWLGVQLESHRRNQQT